MENWLNLKEIFDMDSWEDLQDALSDATKMAIVMVNYKGEPITRHSGCSDFCNIMRHDDRMKKFCQKCDARAGFEAMQENAPFIYKCYFSIVDIAIPIIVDHRYIGAIMAGQIRVGDDGEHLEQLLHVTDRMLLEQKLEENREAYERLPHLSFGRIRVIAKLLYHLCNYMTIESAKKAKILDMYEAVLSRAGAADGDTLKEIPRAAGIALSHPDATEEEHQRELEHRLPEGASRVTKEALKYIIFHPEQMLSLGDVADHCHVSKGYLSRLFTKEMGMSYSQYIPLLKVDWAKELLKREDLTVADVAEQLGYSETGYFIKVFKKYTGATPLVYKKYQNL